MAWTIFFRKRSTICQGKKLLVRLIKELYVFGIFWRLFDKEILCYGLENILHLLLDLNIQKGQGQKVKNGSLFPMFQVISQRKLLVFWGFF